MIFDCNMDRELKKIILKSQIIIVEKVIQHVMEHSSSAEQVLDLILKAIEFNKGQIRKKGMIGIELIENAMKPFIATVKAELSVNIEEGLDVGEENFPSQGYINIIDLLGSKLENEQVELLRNTTFRQGLIQFIKAQDSNSLQVEKVLGEKARQELETILIDITNDDQPGPSYKLDEVQPMLRSHSLSSLRSHGSDIE